MPASASSARPKPQGRLQHQNIVTIFDAGEEHDLAYIAMEFLKGKDLVDFCKDGNLLPVPKVLSIVARVAEALAYAHRQNVVHRDIKPANIMYELESDTVKVTDFGIARITDSSKTKTGLVLGTPSFMSPEQIAGKKVDGRSDLYSLGVMLFQMLAGVLPFRGDSMAELMYKIANEEAPDIRIIRKEIPSGWPRSWRCRWPSAAKTATRTATSSRPTLRALTSGGVPAAAPGAPVAATVAHSATPADEKTVAFRADEPAHAGYGRREDCGAGADRTRRGLTRPSSRPLFLTRRSPAMMPPRKWTPSATPTPSPKQP
jgi:serine/threonine protein kinase